MRSFVFFKQNGAQKETVHPNEGTRRARVRTYQGFATIERQERQERHLSGTQKKITNEL